MQLSLAGRIGQSGLAVCGMMLYFDVIQTRPLMRQRPSKAYPPRFRGATDATCRKRPRKSPRL